MPNEDLENEATLRARVEQRLNKRREFLTHTVVYALIMAALWGAWLLGGGGSLWPLWLTLAWGAGYVAHGIDTFYQAGWPALAQDRAVWREMRALYGEDWRVSASEEEYNAVRSRIGKPGDKRREFSSHLAVYLLINAMFWVIWLPSGGFPWPLLISAGWGIGLISHAAETFFGQRQSGAIEREVERERERLEQEAARGEKRKRGQARLQLTSDGELLEIVDDEQVEETRRKRG